MSKYLEKLYREAEQSIQNQIPWSATNNGTMVVDVEEFVKRDVFWKAVEEFEEFKDSYICDCAKNYGKDCLFPEKYRNGGCN